MTQQFAFLDVVLFLISDKLKPSHINLDILKALGIIDQDWEEATPGIYAKNVTQITLKNGLIITLEAGRLIIVQPVRENNISDLLIPEVTRKFTTMMSNLEFSAVAINPRGFISFSGEQGNARRYITENLLAPGTWLEEGSPPLTASVNLVYKRNGNPFSLAINEAGLRQEDETTIPVVMFNGNFSYELTGEDSAERIHNLHQALDNWSTDLNTFTDIINSKFLPLAVDNITPISDISNNSNIFAMSASV